MLEVNATLLPHCVPLALLAHVASWPYSEIRAETSEELLELKSMFANPKHGSLHNGRTCVQCIPWMPAGEVPYQSLQLFWCVVQRPPCPPHRPGMCSLWASRLWERPAPPRCLAPPQSLQPPNEYWRLWSLHCSMKDLSLSLCPPESLTSHNKNLKNQYQICFDLFYSVQIKLLAAFPLLMVFLKLLFPPQKHPGEPWEPASGGARFSF